MLFFKKILNHSATAPLFYWQLLFIRAYLDKDPLNNRACTEPIIEEEELLDQVNR